MILVVNRRVHYYSQVLIQDIQVSPSLEAHLDVRRDAFSVYESLCFVFLDCLRCFLVLNIISDYRDEHLISANLVSVLKVVVNHLNLLERVPVISIVHH